MQSNTCSRRRQRGVGALAVSMLLLFASSIVVFYLNRGLIFEQKTAANQVRSTSAFEMAEAGIEWATGMMNGQVDIDANCNFLSTATSSFRRIYIQAGWPGNTNVQAAANVFPGCKLNGTTLTCGCPAAGSGVASLGSTVQPSFSVAFAAVAGDPTAVRVTSTGCTAQAGTCAPATTGASDANARVEVILKLNPTLRAAPSAALTCGGACQVGGSYNVRNYEVSSNGYLVNAGTTITSGMGTGYETIPGQPVTNALIAADQSLAALSQADPTCTNSALFQAYFGTTMAAYAAGPDVKTIPGCDNANACGSLMLTAYNDGWRNFYFPDGFALNNSAPFSVLGANAAGQGVNIVTPGTIDINGNITINGLLFSNSAAFNDLGTGTADVNGAIITCNNHRNNGNGLLSYSSAALGGTGLRPGLMVRVPGSWRDFQ
jgi:hypothetical protein